jgi:hypothetical protein
MDYTDPTQTLGTIDFGPGEPYGWGARGRHGAVPVAQLSPVTISEVLRDVDALGEATEAT